MFIAFDGIDGSGKSTLSKMVYEYFLEQTNDVELYDMGNFGVLDEYLLKIRNQKGCIPAEIRELLFYFEGRLFSDFVEENDSKIIITDRYFLTYYSYGPINGICQERVHQFAHKLKKPDYYFFLDVAPDEALRRIAKYRKIDPPEVGYQTSLSVNEDVNRSNFLKAQGEIFTNYKQAILHYGSNIHILDGMRTPSDNFDEVIATIQTTSYLDKQRGNSGE